MPSWQSQSFKMYLSNKAETDGDTSQITGIDGNFMTVLLFQVKAKKV